MINHPAILAHIRAQYALHWHGLHGVDHWARVCENGLRVAASVDANLAVVELFALFHDACRLNDGHDPEHGARGAELAHRVRAEFLADLDDHAFNLLCEACEGHTHIVHHVDPTIQACWDADRLDLARVGKMPQPKYLNTEEARDPNIINWANERAMNFETPDEVLARWGD